jgi:predicted oxidoreductase
VQAWSPLRGDLLSPPAEATPELKKTAQVLTDLAKKKGTTPSAIALAWLLRHPIGIVPLIGASNPEHVIENCAADGIDLSREEWYALFASAASMQLRCI